MKEIENIEWVLDMDADWTPSFISFVSQVNYFVESKLGTLSLKCLWQQRNKNKPWPEFSSPFFEIELMFKGVQSLNLKFSGGQQQLSGFDIINISKDGFENINFKIEDYEDGAIGFSCKSICITKVSDKLIFL